MLNMMPNQSKWGVLLHGVLAAFLLAGSGAALAAPVTVDLCATTGSVTLPAATGAINILGYAAGVCSTTATASAPGGPVIDVNVGDVVTVNLYNSLSEATGLLFQGQSMVPDTTGAAAATGATYGAKIYTFTATSPGTFLYEAAPLPNAEYQTAMGLYGALIVRPAPVPLTGISVTPATTGSVTRADAAATYTSGSNVVVDTAVSSTDLGAVVNGPGIPFGTTITAVTDSVSFTMSARASAAYGASTVFNDEAALVLSEIDPALNNSASPAAFDMRNYAPRYFLINGKAYPDTAPIASAAGNKVLLRYVNAGVKHHSMAVLGLRQNFVAKDASLLPTLTLNVAAETLAPGQTGDAVATVPAVTSASKFAVYDGNLALHNNGADNAFGGMLTFVIAGTGSAATGPTTSAVALTPNPTNGSVSVALSASISSTLSTVAAAEYFIDTTGAAGTGCPMTLGTMVSAMIPISGASLPCRDLASLTSGNHTVYVHGQDATTPTGQWGAFSSAVLNLDKAGPLTSGLTLTPNPSSGSVGVALNATGNDSATGNSNIAAAEYSIDGGTAVAMTVNVSAPIASLSANIPAGLSAGAHTVAVRSQDALGNWGGVATITLNVVAGGPQTSAVSATRNPNNGALPLNASQPVVRVTATMTSTGSTVNAAEGFIDTVGSNGTGFPFLPGDGVWNGPSETGYADIPLATINALPAGNHTIYVHGKDATGNWGATATTILVIDKAAPTVSAVTLTPSASNNASVVIGASASDAATGNSNLIAAEYSIDTAAAAGTGAAMALATVSPSTTISATISAATVGALTAGNHTVYVRARDAAGNWSGTGTATLLIDRTAPTISSVTLTPGTLVIGTTSTSLAVAAADIGTSVTGGQYWIDGTATPPANATMFNGASATINTSALAAGSHIVRVRVQDAATNWSAVSSATLYVLQAVNDARAITANGNTTQTSDANAAAGVLANDQPVGAAGRTATLVSGPVRTSAGSGTGTGTISVTCGTATTTGVCTNGAYRVTLTGVGNTSNQRAASKRGTYQFTYTETLNNVTTPAATVTITVN